MKTQIILEDINLDERSISLTVNGEAVSITYKLDGDLAISAEDSFDLNDKALISDLCSFVSTNELIAKAFPSIEE